MKTPLHAQIRQGLFYLWVVIIAPLIGIFALAAFTGTEFFTTETGMFALIGVAILSGFVGMFIYISLFPEYASDADNL
jgi:hypothetical protein